MGDEACNCGDLTEVAMTTNRALMLPVFLSSIPSTSTSLNAFLRTCLGLIMTFACSLAYNARNA